MEAEALAKTDPARVMRMSTHDPHYELPMGVAVAPVITTRVTLLDLPPTLPAHVANDILCLVYSCNEATSRSCRCGRPMTNEHASEDCQGISKVYQKGASPMFSILRALARFPTDSLHCACMSSVTRFFTNREFPARETPVCAVVEEEEEVQIPQET